MIQHIAKGIFLKNHIDKKEKKVMVIIKWTNKFSGETGFVSSLSMKEKHFNNTFDAAEAKQYSEKAVKAVFTKLDNFGETENNVFETLEV